MGNTINTQTKEVQRIPSERNGGDGRPGHAKATMYNIGGVRKSPHIPGERHGLSKDLGRPEIYTGGWSLALF